MFRVKELAQVQGMNITHLANKAGLAYSVAYNIWTNRTKNPALSTLASIAKALDVPIWALFSDAPYPERVTAKRS